MAKTTETPAERTAEQTPAAEQAAEGTGGLPSVMTVGGRELQAMDFGEDSGVGMENLEISEQLIPFMALLQGLSPQVDRSKPEFVEGAEMGQLFNTATKATYPVVGTAGLPFLPVWREHQFTEWVPRTNITYPDGRVIHGSANGGFRGIHDPNGPEVRAAIDDAVTKYGRAALFRPLPFHNDEQNEDTVLIDQFNLGIIYGWPELDEFSARRAMLAFTSTKIGVYRSFITACDDIKYPNPRTGRMEPPPMWAHRWRLGSVSQTNAKGTFFNYRVSIEKRPEHLSLVPMNTPLYAAAKEFSTQWRAGQVKGDYQQAAGAGADGTTPAAGGIDPNAKDIPF